MATEHKEHRTLWTCTFVGAVYTFRRRHRQRFSIVSMVTGRMSLEPILPIKQPITIGTMLNFDGDGHGDGVGMCKQNFRTTAFF